MDQSFGKQYKLCSRKRISEVFEAKQSVKAYPLLAHFLHQERTDEDTPFQIVISAPKRNFRKAHDRNRVKRLMREAFRKNKLPLETFLNAQEKHMALFLIYTGREEMPLSVMEKKTKQLISELIKQSQ